MKLFELDDQLDTNQINFDVVEDLHIFMRNDPAFYRKNYYPTMCSLGDMHESSDIKATVKKLIFPLIDEAAKTYCQKYGIGRNPMEFFSLEDKKNLTRKIYSEEMPAIRKGDYK
jgi:hypothetical protein